MITDKEKNQLMVTQANILAQSAHRLTLLEKRLLLLVIAKTRRNDLALKEYNICMVDIAAYLNIDPASSYRRIEQVMTMLHSRTVSMRVVPDEYGKTCGWKKFPWVYSSEYLSQKMSPTGKACVIIKIHPDLTKMLIGLSSQFTNIPFINLSLMSSLSSIRLVEILYSSCQSLIIKELRFGVEQLKFMLGIDGKYRNFASFSQRVLEPAVRDFHSYSPIIFSWKPLKTGSKITDIIFSLRGNTPSSVLSLPDPEQINLTDNADKPGPDSAAPENTGSGEPSQADPPVGTQGASLKERKAPNQVSSEFDKFWNIYPKKVGKKNCLRKWKARKLDDESNLIIQNVLERVANDRQWLEGYAPNPETYINGDRWKDEQTVATPPSSGTAKERICEECGSETASIRTGAKWICFSCNKKE